MEDIVMHCWGYKMEVIKKIFKYMLYSVGIGILFILMILIFLFLAGMFAGIMGW